MNLAYAEIIALDIWERLKPHCSKIKIAGSVRRRKPEVKDIELVLIVSKTLHKEYNIFGEVCQEYMIYDPGFEKQIKEIGTIAKGKITGKYLKLEVKHVIHGVEQLINVDIFMPQEHDYYRQLAIRTGSAEYTRKYISGAWVKKGWCGANGDLRLQNECCCKIVDGKNVWSLKGDIKEPTAPPVWESEQQFFKWLGVQWMEPKERSL